MENTTATPLTYLHNAAGAAMTRLTELSDRAAALTASSDYAMKLLELTMYRLDEMIDRLRDAAKDGHGSPVVPDQLEEIRVELEEYPLQKVFESEEQAHRLAQGIDELRKQLEAAAMIDLEVCAEKGLARLAEKPKSKKKAA